MQNRAEYAAKFRALAPRLAQALPCAMPEAAFYLWARTPGDDAAFARRLYAEENVTVLPGSYVARTAHGAQSRRRPHPHRARAVARRVHRGHRAARCLRATLRSARTWLIPESPRFVRRGTRPVGRAHAGCGPD